MYILNIIKINIEIDIIHDCNNEFVFPTHSFFMIKKTTIVVVDE
jgi:hypothetical protein